MSWRVSMIWQDQSSCSIIRTTHQHLMSTNDNASVSTIESAINSPGHVSAESFILTDMLCHDCRWTCIFFSLPPFPYQLSFLHHCINSPLIRSLLLSVLTLMFCVPGGYTLLGLRAVLYWTLSWIWLILYKAVTVLLTHAVFPCTIYCK